MVVLSADHAEAFNRATRAAGTVMGFLGLTQGTLGVLKSPTFFNVGPIDFTNNVISKGAAVEEFGDHLILHEQRIAITELRNQLNGHIRVAMNDSIVALGTTSINLIFYTGGALVIAPPKEAPGPFRIAMLRFEGAKNVTQERHCVAANRASQVAYKTLWNMLEEKIRKHNEQNHVPQSDVLDEPGSAPASGFSFGPPPGHVPALKRPTTDSFDDEEDAIDGMGDALPGIIDEHDTTIDFDEPQSGQPASDEPPASTQADDDPFAAFNNVQF
jgi:hypothetical protein